MEALGYLLGFYEAELGPWNNRVYAVNVNQAISVSHKYTSAAVDGYRERVALDARRDPLPTNLAKVYRGMLTYGGRTSREQWLIGRGISEQAVDDFYLGHDGTRFTIPFFDKDGRLLTLRFRRDDYYGLTGWDDRELPKYNGLTGRNASGAYLYPEWLVATQEEDHVVVVESELCVVRLRQEGIPAVCTFSGAGSLKFVPGLLKQFPNITRVWVAGDMDDAGYAGSAECGYQAASLGYGVRILHWESSFGKDPTELYLNGHTLEEVGYERG
jgi:hypothetical protein